MTCSTDESVVEAWAKSNCGIDKYLIVNGPVDQTKQCVVQDQIVQMPQSDLNEQQWKRVRARRDRLLNETDWRVTKAIETGQPINQEWAAYRQNLREVTLQADPFNIEWPIPPTT